MRRAVFFLFLAVLAGVPTGVALAQGRNGQQRGGVLPLDRILPEVRRSHPGEFYDAEGPRRGPDGQEHYSLKWMRPDGRVEWLDTDARTGRVLGQGQGQGAQDRGQERAQERNNFGEPRSRNFGGGNFREFRQRDFGPGDGGRNFNRGDRRERFGRRR